MEPADITFASNYGLALHQRAMQQHANVTRATYDYVKEQCFATYLAAEDTLTQVRAYASVICVNLLICLNSLPVISRARVCEFQAGFCTCKSVGIHAHLGMHILGLCMCVHHLVCMYYLTKHRAEGTSTVYSLKMIND
jgi:hypothetical protein